MQVADVRETIDSTKEVIVPVMQPPKGHNGWIPQYGSQSWDVLHLNVTKNS